MHETILLWRFHKESVLIADGIWSPPATTRSPSSRKHHR